MSYIGPLDKHSNGTEFKLDDIKYFICGDINLDNTIGIMLGMSNNEL